MSSPPSESRWAAESEGDAEERTRLLRRPSMAPWATSWHSKTHDTWLTRRLISGVLMSMEVEPLGKPILSDTKLDCTLLAAHRQRNWICNRTISIHSVPSLPLTGWSLRTETSLLIMKSQSTFYHSNHIFFAEKVFNINILNSVLLRKNCARQENSHLKSIKNCDHMKKQ